MKTIITEINKKGYVVDDTILVKDYLSTAGSKMLYNFVPLFSAEAVERLAKKGYTIKGKTNVGEFGLDILGETSYYGETSLDDSLCSACAIEVKNGADFGLSVDLNGAPRRAAMISNTMFIKPTYGTVSRYGVIPCACSGEGIGVMANTVEKIKEVLEVIAGVDLKDGTTTRTKEYKYDIDTSIKGLKACLVSELYDLASKDVKQIIDTQIDKLKSEGVTVEKISIKEIEEIATAWNICLAAETCNNVSRYDGVKFGYRSKDADDIDKLYVNSRTEAFGYLTKMTILYGSDVLSKGRYDVCYDKALKTRRLALDLVKDIFSKFDFMIMPNGSKIKYPKYDLIDSFKAIVNESVFTSLPSITGLPALSCGSQFVANHFNDSVLLRIAKALR